MNQNTIFLIVFLVMNIVGFILMGVDKSRAKKHQYRIREKTLWLVAILGGAVGSTAGMKYFRHKTKHLQFKFGFPILAIIELIILVYQLK